MTGWYGVGTAIDDYLEHGMPKGPKSRTARLKQLRTMAKDWPLFRTLLSNMEMVLAKSDLTIARGYAELVPNRSLRERIFGLIETEHARTVTVLKLLTQRELLANEPLLLASLQQRFAYIDPLNYLQIELLRRWRAASQRTNRSADGNAEAVRTPRAIHLTINGVAAGLRNSG